MGAKCGKVTCCGLWMQRSNPGCYIFEQSSGVGSREARLPPINGWQVRDKRLNAYTFLFLPFLTMTLACVFLGSTIWKVGGKFGPQSSRPVVYIEWYRTPSNRCRINKQLKLPPTHL